MIWLGIIIGFCVGVTLVTLLYAPLVDKVHALEKKLMIDQELIDDAIVAIKKCQAQNHHLLFDLEQMERLLPPEVYATFFDAPYKN